MIHTVDGALSPEIKYESNPEDHSCLTVYMSPPGSFPELNVSVSVNKGSAYLSVNLAGLSVSVVCWGRGSLFKGVVFLKFWSVRLCSLFQPSLLLHKPSTCTQNPPLLFYMWSLSVTWPGSHSIYSMKHICPWIGYKICLKLIKNKQCFFFPTFRKC